MIVALDLATVLGFAVGSSGAGLRDCHVTETHDLNARAVKRFSVPSSRVSHGHLYACLSDILRHRIGQLAGLGTVAIEEHTGRGPASNVLTGFRAIAESFAAEKGARVVILSAVEARKLALGYGGGDKVQAHSLARALQLPGITQASTDDERDACILLEATRVFLAAEAREKVLKAATKQAAREAKKAARRVAK